MNLDCCIRAIDMGLGVQDDWLDCRRGGQSAEHLIVEDHLLLLDALGALMLKQVVIEVRHR